MFDLLARLVLECRVFRGRLSELSGDLPRRNQAPFLFRQFEEEIELIVEALEGFGGDEKGSRRSRSGDSGFLSRLLGRRKSAREEALNMMGGFDLQGRAWTIPVSEVIGFLSSSGKTGVLTVHSTNENFEVALNEGQLVSAKSDQTPDGMRVGQILSRKGVLPADEIERLARKARKSDELLGAYLLKRGLVGEKDLHDALSIQVQSMFHRLFTAENAIYRFREGARMKRVQNLGLNITSLLLESARFHDEKDFRTEDAIEMVVGSVLEEFGARSLDGERAAAPQEQDATTDEASTAAESRAEAEPEEEASEDVDTEAAARTEEPPSSESTETDADGDASDDAGDDDADDGPAAIGSFASTARRQAEAGDEPDEERREAG